MPQLPDPPPPYDEQKLPAVNAAWKILDDGLPARPAGLSGQAFDAVWPTIKAVLERQMAFNAALVEHLNRNAVPHREAHASLAQAIAVLRDSFAALSTFESLAPKLFSDKDWQANYQKVSGLVESGYREVFSVVE